MPLEYLGELTSPFMNVKQILSEEFANKFVDDLR